MAAGKATKTGKSEKGDKLATYRRMRDAARTPEPVPEQSSLPHGADDTFVIQEHHARRLHWDLRLERDGVLVSWAVPKGIPTDPKTNHLAVHTEDHPLEYAEFEGEIPKGEYGGGRMFIWDRGTYETEKWSDREVKIVLLGSRVSGRYVLFQTDGKNWMIHRMDPPADPDAEPLPEGLRPMLPQERRRLPRDPEAYGFEFAWGGRRALAYISGGRATLTDGSGGDVPLRSGLGSGLGTALGARPALLDGELTEVEGDETYMIFDLLHLEGRSLLAEPYERRRRRLDELHLAGPRWQTAPWFPGEGAAVREAARRQGLPGIVAKRLDSPYEPGKRSAAWLLIPT
ncbi:DNA polymerase ligase N-terminal domain-containing protein [Actinomadura alba]|uniref:DNA polymerase ligase N-terminal domain-containing protein n=1 Tax=Actinomadura alba TaxID=406431 RepID=UPI0028A8CCA3|nr:DNA polymerase ligase N-terminal domain-containing protein [Actinomadura alba]